MKEQAEGPGQMVADLHIRLARAELERDEWRAQVVGIRAQQREALARAERAESRNKIYEEALPPITLDLTPHDVGRALEALREGRGMIAEMVADKLAAAAPRHVAILDETGWFDAAHEDAEQAAPPAAWEKSIGDINALLAGPESPMVGVARMLDAMREDLSGVRVDLSQINRAFRKGSVKIPGRNRT